MINRYVNNSITTVDKRVDAYNIQRYATNDLTSQIYQDCDNGIIPFKQILFREGDRLDLIAAREYGDGLDWWLIAAASGIGWWLQINPGTVIRIPDMQFVKVRFNL
jgi:phage tail protein X